MVPNRSPGHPTANYTVTNGKKDAWDKSERQEDNLVDQTADQIERHCGRKQKSEVEMSRTCHQTNQQKMDGKDNFLVAKKWQKKMRKAVCMMGRQTIEV